jgi:hypothetical protein
MLTNLTVPSTCRAVADPSRRRALTPTPTLNRHERKSLICNHPDRATIAFLIDTAAIRNAPNSFRTNETFISNRHKTGPFYVPYNGAGLQSASAYGGDGSTPPQSYTSTRYKLEGATKTRPNFTAHGSQITVHESQVTNHSPIRGRLTRANQSVQSRRRT